MKPLFTSGALLLLGTTLLGCGAGAGGGGGNLAGGGISGSGSGTVTSFGSIILNGNGEFETTDAVITIDGESATETDLNLGMVVDTDISDADEAFTRGNADTVRVMHEIKGPITSLNPLQVFGQTVVVTGDTLIQHEDQNGRDPNATTPLANLKLNDPVEVSGRRDDSGIIQASRIELKSSTGLTVWKLMGRVKNLTGSQFTIGENLAVEGMQRIDFGTVTPSNCGSGLQNGKRVEVKGTAPVGFNAGNTFNASNVECKPDAITPNSGLSGSIEGEFEGFITTLPTDNSFTLGDQLVSWNSATEFEGGTDLDLAIGVKLDVRGSYDIGSGLLSADEIHFRESRFRIEAPADVLTSTNTELLGLNIIINAKTEVDGDAAQDQQLRVRGFVDSSGTLFADEVEKRNETPDLTDIRLRGRVDAGSIDLTTSTFTLFGITIDGSSASLPANFFAILKDGSEVEVEHGVFTGGMITNAQIELENEDD